jgi:CRP/FNR family transcriptional regulator
VAEIEARRDEPVPKLCSSCDARHRGVCGALSARELMEISKQSHRKTVAHGETLIFDDESVFHYANIVRGIVKLSKIMADGRQQIVGLQFAPDFLGRPFAKESRLTAEAASEVEVCVFPKTAFENMLRRSPELEHRLFSQTLVQLDEAREWMVTLGRKTATEKVASFMYLISSHIDPTQSRKQTVRFDLPLTRSDIADFLGLTIETVSRQITKLRKSGLIEVENNRSITVPSLKALSRVAGS